HGNSQQPVLSPEGAHVNSPGRKPWAEREGAAMRTVLALLLLAGTAQAGLYNLNDPGPRFFKSLGDVRAHVKQLQGLNPELKPGQTPDKGSLRVLYPQQAERLEALLKDGTISTLERVDLSACYIRMGEPDKALKVLEGANQDHFMVQANMAIAYLGLG